MISFELIFEYSAMYGSKSLFRVCGYTIVSASFI